MMRRSASPPGYRLSEEAGNRALEHEAKLEGDWQSLFGLFYFLWVSMVDQVMNNSGYLQQTDKEHTASSSKIKSESNKIDWSLMPRQLFSKIFARLPTAADCITFVSVCRSWRFNIDFESPIPWLVGRQNDPSREIPIYDFFSVFRYSLFPVKDRAACRTGIMCRSSSRGWIILMDIRAAGTFLILWNPVTNLRIQLPPIIAPSHYSNPADYAMVYKTILSADPAVCNNWAALATFKVGSDFCFYRSGDLGWTFFGFSQPNSEKEFNKDVEFYNERFYIAKNVQIFRCELEPTPQVIRLQPVEIILNQDDVETFLVECSKELLFIVNRTGAVKVYKLKFEDNRVTFSELKDLDDWALFLGRNHSFAVDADAFPRCLRNSIYLTDNNEEGLTTKTNVINLKDQSIKTIRYPIVNNSAKAQPFFWLLPSERISKHFEISIPEV